jgi:hypothetical protein
MYKFSISLLMACFMLILMPCAEANDDPCAKFTDTNKQNICKQMVKDLADIKSKFIEDNSASTTEVTTPPEKATTGPDVLKYAFPSPPQDQDKQGAKKTQADQQQQSQESTDDGDADSGRSNIFQ